MVSYSSDLSLDSDTLSGLIADAFVLYFPTARFIARLSLKSSGRGARLCCIHTTIYTAIELSWLAKLCIRGWLEDNNTLLGLRSASRFYCYTFDFQFGQVLVIELYNIRRDRVWWSGKFYLFVVIPRLLVPTLIEGIMRITSLQLMPGLCR